MDNLRETATTPLTSFFTTCTSTSSTTLYSTYAHHKLPYSSLYHWLPLNQHSHLLQQHLQLKLNHLHSHLHNHLNYHFCIHHLHQTTTIQKQKQTQKTNSVHMTILKRRPLTLDTFASTDIRLKCNKKHVLPFKHPQNSLITHSTPNSESSISTSTTTTTTTKALLNINMLTPTN